MHPSSGCARRLSYYPLSYFLPKQTQFDSFCFKWSSTVSGRLCCPPLRGFWPSPSFLFVFYLNRQSSCYWVELLLVGGDVCVCVFVCLLCVCVGGSEQRTVRATCQHYHGCRIIITAIFVVIFMLTNPNETSVESWYGWYLSLGTVGRCCQR